MRKRPVSTVSDVWPSTGQAGISNGVQPNDLLETDLAPRGNGRVDAVDPLARFALVADFTRVRARDGANKRGAEHAHDSHGHRHEGQPVRAVVAPQSVRGLYCGCGAHVPNCLILRVSCSNAFVARSAMRTRSTSAA